MTSPNLSPLTAAWIWHAQADQAPYHQVISARRSFQFRHPGSAWVRIAVDGAYRLFVNGQWAADGPARSWPNHMQYDQIDITAYLVDGSNRLEIIARHWQVGDFHSQPQQAGMLVQIDLALTGGVARIIRSDGSWQTALLPAWVSSTPKVSIQMEPQEVFDARLNHGRVVYQTAQVLYSIESAPWQGLHPREVALMNHRPLDPLAFKAANLLRRRTSLDFCFPAVRLAHPGVVEANNYTAAAAGMATLLMLEEPGEVELRLDGMAASIDGVTPVDNRFRLDAGPHVVAAFAWPLFSHQKERGLQLINPPADLRLANPLDPDNPNPWVYLPLPEFAHREDDMVFMWFPGPGGRRDAVAAACHDRIQFLLASLVGVLDVRAYPDVHSLPADEMFVLDTHTAFLQREVIADACSFVQKPAGLMHDNAEYTTILPSPDGDIELVIDFGMETVGYWQFEMLAEVGVFVDMYAVEYMDSKLGVQHTWNNRNGMRYITRAGINRFTSLKRRAGRYLFITLRNQTLPLQIRLLRTIESTYPVEWKGSFDCSDSALRRVWEISARTLVLCMEDTFTDCPLYEQTHWVGDARNEALYAFDVFGATDIARNCLRLTAQSLERFPITGCQVPSGWDCLLPAWSFLWTIGVWDLYYYSGDRSVLEEFWPAVVQNLEGAQALTSKKGLFSGPFWNMFDWAGVDDHQETVLHNSLLMVGALQAARKIAAELGNTQGLAWLEQLHADMVAAINRTWDPDRQVYPDSLHEDGSPSPSICQHTHFLALLYDVVEPGNRSAALRNVLTPQPESVHVGSPFVVQYLYEMLEKEGLPAEILHAIHENYLPMLAAGATTVWESFPTGITQVDAFPTRSHCHAWSASPLTFLPRTVLGIHQTAPGGGAYTISPWVDGLNWAKGAIATARGTLEVEWKRDGSNLVITTRAPEGVLVTFKPNASHQGLDVAYQ